ncbi:unnamed protein product [Boreogadus saida]
MEERFPPPDSSTERSHLPAGPAPYEKGSLFSIVLLGSTATQPVRQPPPHPLQPVNIVADVPFEARAPRGATCDRRPGVGARK